MFDASGGAPIADAYGEFELEGTRPSAFLYQLLTLGAPQAMLRLPSSMSRL